MHRAVQDVLIKDVGSKRQVRKELTEAVVASLMDSIQKQGVMVPLLGIVEDGKVHLWDGHHRLEACVRLGMEKVPMLLDQREMSSEETVGRAVTVNTLRSELSPIERADALHEMVQARKCSIAEAAARCGMTPSAASKLLALRELPESIQAKVHAGVIPGAIAYEVARIEDAEEQARVATEVVEQGLTRADVLERIGTKKSRAASGGAKDKRAMRAVADLGDGRQLILHGFQPPSMDQLIALLEDVLVKARKYRTRGMDVPAFLEQIKLDGKFGRKPADDAAQPSPVGGAA